jgi:hypothetical protein
MGQRGELFTDRVFFQSGQKTFFFNVKENRQKDLFLNIVETKRKQDNGFERHSIMVYKEDLQAFLAHFSESGKAMTQNRSFEDKELGSESGKRKYLFLVKAGKTGIPFLIITESRKGDTLDYQNESLRVFSDQIELFQGGLEKAAEFMLSR